MSKRPRTSCRGRNFSKFSLLLTAAVLTACAGSAQQQQSAPANPPAPQQQPPPQAAATPARADAKTDTAAAQALADVQGALARVYHDAVALEAGRATPFVVGDFNGDDSEDIAVVVTPARGKLPSINSEYASWLVGDPQKVLLPEVRGDVKVFPKRPEPVVVRQDDVLLAVIHGYRLEGWRNPSAAQTFLLRNAVGDEMQTRPARTLPDTAAASQLRGDVIWETLSGRSGFIYWTGAKYAWAGPAAHGR